MVLCGAVLCCLQSELMVATNLFAVYGKPATLSRITLAFMQDTGVCMGREGGREGVGGSQQLATVMLQCGEQLLELAALLLKLHEGAQCSETYQHHN
jgi:hypothetical protein